jgi:hypothetical protein
MPVTLDQAAFENLQTAFREVALRAERLQEWVALSEKYRVVDRSTSSFWSTARAAAVDWSRVEESWHVVRVDDLPALEDYIKAMTKVRSPLTGEPADGQGQRINDWRTALNDLASQIDKEVNDQSDKQIKAVTPKFTDSIRSQMNQLKGIIDREIGALCLQTQLLRQKIEL